MRTIFAFTAALAFVAGCGAEKAPENKTDEPAADQQAATEKKVDAKAEAKTFLAKYNEDYAALEKTQTLGYWKAAISGKKEDWDAFAEAELALKKLHSDKDRYTEIEKLLEKKNEIDALDARALGVAFLAFKGNQLPEEMLEKLVKQATAIQESFNNFRAELDGEKLTNNDLLERLAKETKTAERKKLWKALKQVGGAVGPKLVELAKLRNEAAKTLGYRTFWEMQIDLQEHDPGELLTIFAELEKLTDEPFTKMKQELDTELAKRFKIKPEQMMPWHYDNPFFQ
ncbi:MAG: M2 family metallopeptidase, partial [Deltaproteobacteria bacterium]|nr:M2 family metallopeptidase [Deltaproteobacteria bacterium]